MASPDDPAPPQALRGGPADDSPAGAVTPPDGNLARWGLIAHCSAVAPGDGAGRWSQARRVPSDRHGGTVGQGCGFQGTLAPTDPADAGMAGPTNP
jgi:hypothetical protein